MASSYATFMYHEISYNNQYERLTVQRSINGQNDKLMAKLHKMVKQKTNITQEMLDEHDAQGFNDWYISAEEAEELGVIDIILDDDDELDGGIEDGDVNRIEQRTGQSAEVRRKRRCLSDVSEREMRNGQDLLPGSGVSTKGPAKGQKNSKAKKKRSRVRTLPESSGRIS